MKHLSFFMGLLAFLMMEPAFSQPIVYPSLDQPASVKKTGKNDVAVIVAVENYIFLPSVKGAVTNANDWETFFKSSLGVDKVHLLIDQQATREQVERFARTAAKEAKPGGTVWFVFIGHGSPAKSGDDGLLVGVDAQQDPDSLFARGFAQQDLLNLLNTGKQEQTVVIVDACFSGRASNGQALAPAQPVIPTVLQLNLSKKTVVFSAAEATEFAGSLPGADRPAFSYLLLGALRGWSKDKSGDVTAQNALSFTKRALRGIPGRFQQTPGIYGDDKLVLVRAAKEADPGVHDLMRNRGKHDLADGDTCDDGKTRSVDTNGNCCWPGQAWNGKGCVGIPTACPSGTSANPKKQSCEPVACTTGMVRQIGERQCCWPDQVYATGRGVCVGVPSCPKGTRVEREQCTPEDPAAWYEKACNKGDASGCETLAFIYYNGDGQKKDLPRASNLFEKACNLGSGNGCAGLGWFYKKGEGRVKDLARASDLYEKACILGESSGCTVLAGAYREGEGRVKDLTRASDLFDKACNMGSANACANLGRSYENAEGRIKDLARAGDLYEKACDMGSPVGCATLGWCYKNGEGRKQDSARGNDLYEKACGMSEPTACYNLGTAYLTGEGLKKDSVRANDLFRKACSMGHAKACAQSPKKTRDSLGFDVIDLHKLAPK